MTLSIVIIDDEYLAIDILRDYSRRLGGIIIQQAFTRPAEALAWLQEHKVDLVLLDIQMPGLDGFALLQQLEEPPAVIFTTARHDHAVRAFELDVVDYLVKPVGFERFEKAIARVRDYVEYDAVLQKRKAAQKEFLVIKSDSRIVKIPISDIEYIEGLSEYVKIYTAQKNYITLAALKELVKLLPEETFIRVHKSYIVSTRSVQEYTSQTVRLPGNRTLPVGRVYKEMFLKKMGS
jgi:DNA-binding LytR/AlgR family response regulator